MRIVAVVTTIHPPTKAIEGLAARLPGGVIIIGDRKTPGDWRCDGVDFHALDRQSTMAFTSVAHLPVDHYARKNLGYLQAMRQGAEIIYDTDDDNSPIDAWTPRAVECMAEPFVWSGWCNVYALLHAVPVWPRGFPLERVREEVQRPLEAVKAWCPIQQGMADGEPDVDAVWRLTMLRRIRFARQRSVALAPGVWCPFNSQSTWWWPEAFPLLYLPASAPFRMTDIWRSFVAQRCLWEMGGLVAFHSPAEVVQDRNPHDLLRDFEDEIPGYLHNGRIVGALENLQLRMGPEHVGENVLACYEAMVRLGVLPSSEMAFVKAWLYDVRRIAYTPGQG